MIRKSSIQIHLNWFKLRRQAATLFQLNCVFACAVWGPRRTKLTSATAQFLLYEAAGLSTSLAFPSHTHTHSQPIGGLKSVTFAYLVSRVTRKKLSSGASIQLGRLLRIMTPPREFPLLLLRPLCYKKAIICFIWLEKGLMQLSSIYFLKRIRHLPWGVHQLYQRYLQKKRETCKVCMRELSLLNSIDYFF